MAGTGETSIRSYNYFADSTVVGTTFSQNQLDFVDEDLNINFVSQTVWISNDSTTDTLDFRFTEPKTRLNHGVVTGSSTAFRLREEVEGATSGATADVAFIGDGYILVINEAGGPFQNGEVIDGAISGASATLSTAPIAPIPHGSLGTNEAIMMDFKRARRVYLQGTAAEPYRVMAW